MTGLTFSQDRGLWPSPLCPQETSGAVRAADVSYWLKHVKNTPLQTHTTPTPPSTHSLTTCSYIQVGANLGLMAADLKTITKVFFLFFYYSTGGVSTWPSGWDYGWALLFGCWVWSIVTEDSLEAANYLLPQPLYLRHFPSHLGISDVQNMNQWCTIHWFFALVTIGNWFCCCDKFHVV